MTQSKTMGDIVFANSVARCWKPGSDLLVMKITDHDVCIFASVRTVYLNQIVSVSRYHTFGFLTSSESKIPASHRHRRKICVRPRNKDDYKVRLSPNRDLYRGPFFGRATCTG